jgi:hypothetical protein
LFLDAEVELKEPRAEIDFVPDFRLLPKVAQQVVELRVGIRRSRGCPRFRLVLLRDRLARSLERLVSGRFGGRIVSKS